MSRLFHLLSSHDPEARTGVPRFSAYFEIAFQEVFNITPGVVGAVEWRKGDVCVTDNHLGMLLPPEVRAIVVHHGCASYHYEVDAAWRNAETERMVADQLAILKRPNTRFVAPSAWVRDRFREIAPMGYAPTVIPHWVPLIDERRNCNFGKPVIIGDWRTANKGLGVIDRLRVKMPRYEFRQLDFDGDEARRATYRQADAYLCLSLSEGAPYAVADAEAASLPIVTTEVGNVHEFAGCRVIADRENVEQIGDALGAALANGRTMPSFFAEWTFKKWREAWEAVLIG